MTSLAGLVSVLLLIGFVGSGSPLTAAEGKRPVPVPPRSAPAFDPALPLGATYEGGGRLSTARPISLVSDHFDDDGVADLVCGHSGPDGHFLTLHRGNVD